MSILLTGGAGYIGSTVASALLDAGEDVVLLDNLVAGHRAFLRGRPAYVGDVADEDLLGLIFSRHPSIDTVMHFAARTDIAESVRQPALYYADAQKAQTLLRAAEAYGVRNFIFSSSASIYASSPQACGLCEDAMLDPLSPYAYSKMAFELALKDKCMAGGLNAVVLRYFNPIGADPYMRTGPYKAAPTHLLGVLTKAAAEGWPFTIYGDDYPTRDGTALRDYVHVWDLACAHLSSLAYLRGRHTPFEAINVGAGQGVTVGEFARTFLEVSGAAIPVHTGPRRAGDAAGAYADISKARRLLKWQPKRSLRQGISDALVWERHFRAGGLDKLSQKPPNFH